MANGEQRLSDNIMLMLNHFKQPDPVGLPGDVIPDPCPVADMKQSLSLGTLFLSNTKVYGLSKLRILYVNAEVGDLEVSVFSCNSSLRVNYFAKCAMWCV